MKDSRFKKKLTSKNSSKKENKAKLIKIGSNIDEHMLNLRIKKVKEYLKSGKTVEIVVSKKLNNAEDDFSNQSQRVSYFFLLINKYF